MKIDFPNKKANISKIDIPNILTFIRLFSAPIFAIIFYINTDLTRILSGIIFTLAGITDFLDGYLARSWKVQSNLGRILDPIADKLIVIVAITMLIFLNKINGLNIFAAITILMREIIISGIREGLSGIKLILPVSNLGKIKTTIQIISIIILIITNNDNSLKIFGLILFWIASILSIYSGYQYCKEAFQYLVKNK
jgi:cardiolipin synthase